MNYLNKLYKFKFSRWQPNDLIQEPHLKSAQLILARGKYFCAHKITNRSQHIPKSEHSIYLSITWVQLTYNPRTYILSLLLSCECFFGTRARLKTQVGLLTTRDLRCTAHAKKTLTEQRASPKTSLKSHSTITRLSFNWEVWVDSSN